MKNSERKQELTEYERYALKKKIREEKRKKQAEERMTNVCSSRIECTYSSLLSVHEGQFSESRSRCCVTEYRLAHTYVVRMKIVIIGDSYAEK